MESLDGSGNVTASRLYTPYGSSRYVNGAFPTSYGYTGQRADGTTGLDYYGARYYDPQIGQFTSADTVADGFNRYSYGRGNPETNLDPSGHRVLFDQPQFDVLQDHAGKLADFGAGFSKFGRAFFHYKAWKAEDDYNSQIRALKSLYKNSATGRRTVPKSVRRDLRSQRNQEIKDAENYADDAENTSKIFERIGKGLVIAGSIGDGIFAGADEWNKDSNLDTGTRVARTAAVGTVHAIGTYVAVTVGVRVGGVVGGALVGGLAVGLTVAFGNPELALLPGRLATPSGKSPDRGQARPSRRVKPHPSLTISRQPSRPGFNHGGDDGISGECAPEVASAESRPDVVVFTGLSTSAI